ncbi:MAG: PHP domain-containing protein [Verrucomicrobiae bacterium]|nr:PHP domain-containing protein [Verrucomicrobiae bacterium]
MVKLVRTVFGVALTAAAFVAVANPLFCPELPSGLRVRPENRYFEVRPRVVPANQTSVVEIVPLHEHVRFNGSSKYELTYAPMMFLPLRGGWQPGTKTNVVPENGRIRIKMFFEGEQEHAFVLECTSQGKKPTVGNFRVYSLEEDLYRLRPYKGDFHMHSHYSDGVESPAYVAGACRRAGLDFMALTDHRNYASSIKAIRAFEGVPIDLRIYPGEEVHSPDNPVHIISFGANGSITDLYKNDESDYRKEVEALMKSLPEMPAGVNKFHYAACKWVVDRIRERNGLAMFCHPYWVTGNRHNIDEALLDHIFATELFDAFELVSGDSVDTIPGHDINGLQVARYAEERAKGRRIAICGISDSHGVERSDAFGRYYTVGFAASPELTDLIAAIKDLRSVAVESPGGDFPRAYGPYRLVRYTHFLLRELFPQHDELCMEEGRLMISYAAGDASAAARLAQLKGQTKAFYDRCWMPVPPRD